MNRHGWINGWTDNMKVDIPSFLEDMYAYILNFLFKRRHDSLVRFSLIIQLSLVSATWVSANRGQPQKPTFLYSLTRPCPIFSYAFYSFFSKIEFFFSPIIY